LANFKESINILLDNPDLADETLIKTKLKEFVLLLTKSENAPSELDFLAAMFQPHATDFWTTFNNNLYPNMSMEEFAKLCNTSVSTFKRKFKELYSEMPKKYFSKMKMKKASQLLLIKENRISDVADDCGFDSLATFNRIFKKHVGQSLSEYRVSQNDS
jgi:AraC-like DNA-binding protein